MVGHVSIDFRERKGEREKQQCEKETWIVASSTLPNWGWNPKPRHVPCLEIDPATFQCTEWCSNKLSHVANTDFMGF